MKRPNRGTPRRQLELPNNQEPVADVFLEEARIEANQTNPVIAMMEHRLHDQMANGHVGAAVPPEYMEKEYMEKEPGGGVMYPPTSSNTDTLYPPASTNSETLYPPASSSTRDDEDAPPPAYGSSDA